MTDAKQVLDNWMARNEQDCSQDEQYAAQKAYTDALEETIEAMRKVIWDALTEATTGRHVDRAIRAAQVLDSGLKEHGWPDYDGDDGASNG